MKLKLNQRVSSSNSSWKIYDPLILLAVGSLIMYVGLNGFHDTSSSKLMNWFSLNFFEDRFLIRTVNRVNNISYEDFDRYYNPRHLSLPLVITNAMEEFKPEEWTREAMQKSCGLSKLYIEKNKHAVRFANKSMIREKWAGMQELDIDHYNLTTVTEFMAYQEKNPSVHLHDAPLRHYCPGHLLKIPAPKYFPIDYRFLNIKEFNLIEETWHPCMFISKSHYGTPLHADGGLSRFWVVQMNGRKKWRLFPPSETWRLHPVDDKHEMFPEKFLADAFQPDFQKFPNLKGALVYEAITQPGDILYVPEGWAHQVENIDDSISVSLNYVDQYNKDSYFQYLDSLQSTEDVEETMKRALRRDLASAFFLPLDHPGIHSTQGIQNIPWTEWFDGHDLAKVPASKTLQEFVKKIPNLSRQRDQYGRTPLQIATYFNYINGVKYLVEVGKADVSVPDKYGFTPLQIARKMGHKTLAAYLELVEAQSLISTT